jgi:hypothetical protein
MKNRTWLLVLPLFALLSFTGCQTVETRIKEKPAVFASLDKTTQDRIMEGIIGIGYSEDMVYLALGSPDQIRESVTADKHTLIWIYNSYIPHYDTAFMMSYHRYPYGYPGYYRPYGYGYYYPPYALGPTYTEKEERIRVTFNEGKVSAIDQVRD